MDLSFSDNHKVFNHINANCSCILDIAILQSRLCGCKGVHQMICFLDLSISLVLIFVTLWRFFLGWLVLDLELTLSLYNGCGQFGTSFCYDNMSFLLIQNSGIITTVHLPGTCVASVMLLSFLLLEYIDLSSW